MASTMAEKRKNNNNNSDENETTPFTTVTPLPPHKPQNPQTEKRQVSPAQEPQRHRNRPFMPPTSTTLSPIWISTPSSPTSVQIARVTVLKNHETRRSRDVAFVQFVSRTDAFVVASEMHGKILNGRKPSASIVADNGRAVEFIHKREYKDKSQCGEEGHLSYECPKNQLGPRERLPPKRVRRGGGGAGSGNGNGGGVVCVDEEEYDSGGERFEDDNWASVVDDGADLRLRLGAQAEAEEKRKKVVKKAGYFSDESEDDDDD